MTPLTRTAAEWKRSMARLPSTTRTGRLPPAAVCPAAATPVTVTTPTTKAVASKSFERMPTSVAPVAEELLRLY